MVKLLAQSVCEKNILPSTLRNSWLILSTYYMNSNQRTSFQASEDVCKNISVCFFFPKQLESNYKVLIVVKTCMILTEDLSTHRLRELYLCMYLRTQSETVVYSKCTGERGTRA